MVESNLWAICSHGRYRVLCPICATQVAILTAAAILLPATTIFAKPPLGANPALAPFYEALKQANGNSCCGISDCREVDTKSPKNSPTGHWQVYISKDTFGATAPNAWLEVPDNAIRPDPVLPRPTRGVACWFGANGFYYTEPNARLICFTPPASEG